IASGDTVQTSTVDSSGHDRQRQQVSAPGNPQTGPFYVEGAAPGDVLAVRFDRIVPNRHWAYSGGRVALNTVDPDVVHQLPPERPRAFWDVDVERWTATLEEPQTALGRL